MCVWAVPAMGGELSPLIAWKNRMMLCQSGHRPCPCALRNSQKVLRWGKIEWEKGRQESAKDSISMSQTFLMKAKSEGSEMVCQWAATSGSSRTLVIQAWPGDKRDGVCVRAALGGSKDTVLCCHKPIQCAASMRTLYQCKHTRHTMRYTCTIILVFTVERLLSGRYSGNNICTVFLKWLLWF